MRKVAVMLMVLVVLLAAGSAGAQSVGWSAWLYNPQNGLMTQVSESGDTLDQFALPLAAGTDMYPNKVAVAPSGDVIAYVPYNSSSFQGTLLITRRDQIIGSLILPNSYIDSLQFAANETVFSADSTLLAYGYALSDGGWMLHVIDIASGQTIFVLPHDEPLVAVLGLSGGVDVTPVPRHVSWERVSFNLMSIEAQSLPSFQAYDWNLLDNTLNANPVYASLDADVLLSTGEIVMTLFDERLPNQNSAFPFFQTNSLQIYDPISGGRFPFYNTQDAQLAMPRFIQNGERILVDSVDVNQRFGWRVLERDGRLVGTLPTAVTLTAARGVPDGFVYTTQTFIPDTTTLMAVNTRAGLDAGSPIWTSGLGEIVELVWAGSTLPVAQIALPPWTQLAPPVFAPGRGGAVAPAPNQPLLVNPADAGGGAVLVTPVLGALTPGGLATINTTEGDTLNMRLGPGLNFDIVARLRDGERVTVVEGPRSAEGFTWWKLRTAAGIEGWAVESVQEDGTRLQTLLPG
ncbi:MAG: SH3 domain-containing protein [Anaerolineae bacterium]|nr:SH3 domain-containing protein [Anaerolineae bacterium]